MAKTEPSEKDFVMMKRAYEVRLKKLEREKRFIEFQLRALTEIVRSRDSFRRNTLSLDWGEFVAAFKTPNKGLKEALARATVHRFELGRAWVEARDTSDWILMQWARDDIKTALFNQYGAKFVLKTWQPGKNKS